MIVNSKIKVLDYKRKIKNIFYEIVIFFLKFNIFQKFSKLFVNAYFINKGYCFDWLYLIHKKFK